MRMQVALKKKSSTEDERKAEQAMVTLREALSQVTIAVRETQVSPKCIFPCSRLR